MVTQYAKVTISFSNTRIITYRLKKIPPIQKYYIFLKHKIF